jgi:hypothetical protein
MQTVYGDEFFCEGIGDVVLVYSRSGNSLEVLVLREMAKQLVKFLSYKAPPVGMQSCVDRWVVQNCWSPFHGVNFGHQSTIDNSRGVEQLITESGQFILSFLEIRDIPAEIRMLLIQHITNRIMLQGKQRMHELQSQPPILIKPRQRQIIRISWKILCMPVLSHGQLSQHRSLTECHGRSFIGPV